MAQFDTRALGGDAVAGIVETFHFDPYEDRLVMETTQNVAPILDDNKMFMCDAASGWKGDMHRVASIPLTVVGTHLKGIMDPGGRILDMPRFKAFLNDRDNLWLRTRPGRV